MSFTKKNKKNKKAYVVLMFSDVLSLEAFNLQILLNFTETLNFQIKLFF